MGLEIDADDNAVDIVAMGQSMEIGGTKYVAMGQSMVLRRR